MSQGGGDWSTIVIKGLQGVIKEFKPIGGKRCMHSFREIGEMTQG